MSQQYPYLPNGQAVPQAQNLYPQAGGGLPAANGQPGIMPGQDLPPGMQGMDPALLAQMQQAMAANPDDGDGFDILPGPKEAAIGAAGGIGVAVALNKLEQGRWIDKAAQKLDRFPGASWLNQRIDDQLAKWANNGQLSGTLQEMYHTHTFDEVRKISPNLTGQARTEAIEKAIQASVGQMQERQISTTLNNFQKYNTAVTQNLKTKFAPHKTFAGLLEGIETEISKYTTRSQTAPKELLNLKERISGLNNNYLPVYKEQVALSARLQAKNIGPVGRMFANGVNYLKRIFNGETMRMGGQKAADTAAKNPSLLSRLWGKATQLALPGMAGALIIGQSLNKAKKAKEGEKTQTFFHDFIGMGIGNFVGWEFGRKLLNSTQIISKLLGKRSMSTLPRVFGRVIPIIGGITLGGFVTEMLAMFVIGAVFQKAGELISHKIFGKPSEESIEGKAKKKDPQNPQQTAQTSQKAMQQASDPTRRENIKKMLPQPGSKFPKRPTTQLTPDIIRQSRAAQEQAKIDQIFINTPWDPENQLNPYKTQF